MIPQLNGFRPRAGVACRQLMLVFAGMVAVASSAAADGVQPAAATQPDKTGALGSRKVHELPPAATRKAVSLQRLAPKATADEIALFPGFPEPLQAVGDATADPATGDLVALINRWADRGGEEGLPDLESFIRLHPDSAWTPAIRFNLAKLYHATGYFSRAIQVYQDARRSLAGSSGKEAMFHRSMVVAELAGMYARTGRQDELAALLEEEKDCFFADTAKVRCDQAREGLATMRNQPGISFCCGPYALSNVARQLGIEVPGDFIERNPSEKTGFSLEQVREIAAAQLKLKLAAVKRAPGGEIPCPAVMHLRCGHFAALMEKSGKFYRLSDPTFGKEIWITPDAIEDEGSGHFLVPEAIKLNGLSETSKEVASEVFGKGFATTIDPKATTQCEISSSPCGPPGMASYRMHLLAASLSMSDTPLVIPTGFGPGLSLQVTYNQRESEVSGTKTFTNFGPQWVCNLVSWLEDDPGNDAADVTIHLPGGGSEVHKTYSPTSGYLLERRSLTRIIRTGPGQYERRAQDGSKMVYTRAIGTAGPNRKVFLSEIIDRWGNSLAFSYDTNPLYPARLSSVTSASGQSLYFTYLESSPYLVSAVADDPDISLTARKSRFIYEASRLKTITDPLGIVSRFSYDASGFMNALETPYGLSNFSTGGSSESGSPLRWLEAIDPLGRKERVEFMTEVSQATISATPLPTGTGVSTEPNLRQYRNSFYWSKKAWITAPNDRSKAHLYHWLHALDGTGAYGVLEMEKPPFENNIWYNYPDQANSYFPGPIASPSAVSRAIEKSDGTVASAIERYEYHPETGNLTKHTDAEGRVTSYDYDSSGYDLLSVKTFSPQTTIQSYSNYQNHQPRTLVDAQGQTTTLTYNSHGQVATVTNALNETTTFAYESAPTAFGYGMVKSVTGPQAGAVTSLTYDSSDRVRTVTDPALHTLTYSYDVFDRPTTITYPDSTTEQTVYRLLDVYAIKDRQNRWTRAWYNKLRQPEKVVDPLGRTTLYEWCYCGALQKLTDAKGQITSWKYDAQSRNYEKTYPDNRTESISYQPLSGRVNTTTDTAGQITTHTYNLDGTLKTKGYSNLASGTATTAGVSYTYQADYPRLSTIADGTGTTTLDYYPVGQLGAMALKSTDGPLAGDTDLLTYTYDALGRLKTTRVGPSGSSNLTTRNHDSLGRIQSVVNPLGTFGHFYVGATDLTDHIDYPNGQKTSFSYFPVNGDHRLQTITHLAQGTNPASILSRFDYTYLADGNIATWQRQSGAAPATRLTMSYDAAAQLTSATLARPPLPPPPPGRMPANTTLPETGATGRMAP